MIETTIYGRKDVVDVARRVLGLDLPIDWSGYDPAFPLLDEMRADGAVVLLTLDGSKKFAYSAMVNGGPLESRALRINAATAEEALCFIIGHYDKVLTEWSAMRDRTRRYTQDDHAKNINLSVKKREVVVIANRLSIKINDDWTGIDAVVPLLERMREEGALVLLKLDGERQEPAMLPYTLLVCQGPLGDDFFRMDCSTIEQGLCHIIQQYAATVWL